MNEMSSQSSNDEDTENVGNSRSIKLEGAYVATHETPTEDGASSGPPPSLHVQIERWAAMEGSKKKGRVFGLAGLGAQLLPGASFSSGPSHWEMQLHSELESMRQKMSQIEEKYGAIKAKMERYDAMMERYDAIEAKMERYDAMEAKMAAFEQMSAQMGEFMRMSQMSQGLSMNFSPPATTLLFPSTVTSLASFGQTSGRPASGITFRSPRSPDQLEQDIDSDTED